MQVRLLGSGGFLPTDERETASALVRDGNEALLIDAGTGLSHLVMNLGLLDGVDRVRVLLTHFHLDHLGGIFYLAAIEPEVEIWGAGEALEGVSTRELVGRLLAPPFVDPGFRSFPVSELSVGDAELGRFHIRTRVQEQHPNRTLAVRFGDAFAWCTDTAYDDANVDFARGVRVLFHEAYHAAEHSDDAGHTASGEAARLAAAAGVERLVLVHVNPWLRDDEDLLRHAAPVFAATEVGRDGLVVET